MATLMTEEERLEQVKKAVATQGGGSVYDIDTESDDGFGDDGVAEDNVGSKATTGGSAKQPFNQSHETGKSKYFWTMCIVSAVIILAAGATLAALYAPEHMPDTISKIVEGLSTAAFYGVTGGAAVAGVAGVAGIGAAFYNNKVDKDTALPSTAFKPTNGGDESDSA